jgi:iron complex outermembrane receptor protein
MAGINTMHQSNVYLGRFFIPNYIQQNAGAFVTERFVKHHYEIEASLRFDYKGLQLWFYENKILQNPQLQFINWSAAAGIILKPTHNTKILLHYNKAWRAPAPNELYANGLHHGAASIERGKPDLIPEEAHSVSISLLQQIKIWNLNAGVYYNRIANYIFQRAGSNAELTIKGAFPVFNYTQTDADIYGADLSSKLEFWKGLGWELKLSAVRGYDFRNNEHLVYIPSDRIENTIYWELNVARNGNLYVGAGYQFVNKQWRVPPQSDYAEPPNAYHLFHAELRLKLKIYKQECMINFKVNNINNSKYREYLDRFRYYSDAMGRNYQLRLTVPFSIWKKKTNNLNLKNN